jgi:hypothetical protein
MMPNPRRVLSALDALSYCASAAGNPAISNPCRALKKRYPEIKVAHAVLASAIRAIN